MITPWMRVSFTVIDILLVALIIYEVLVMIRGTRAAPMLAGLAAVAAAFYLARIGELVTLNWLVSHLLPYVVFALIVVFQSEIRHVLSDVGRRVSFLRGNAQEGDAYDDIVLAANLFSQHQTGALMVIEREIGLRTYIESGVAMDAKLSYDLLATIFRPSAPLHDGAVIVSEESGAISMAVGGKIERDLTVEQLREALGNELRRYMSPVGLPTVAEQEDESEIGMESPFRAGAAMSAERESESETERPL